jgi:putative restriction endonuclease
MRMVCPDTSYSSPPARGTSDTLGEVMTGILERFQELSVWQRGSERAPHKPLLILLALGALSRGQRSLSFEQVETKLVELLKEFGPTRKSYHAEYPFWRLQNDGL